MKSIRVCLLALILALAIAPAAFAKVLIPDSVDKSVPMTDPITKNDQYAIVIVNGAELMESYELGSEPVKLNKSQKPAYLEALLCFAENTAKTHYLVQSQKDTKVWGWISKRDILTRLFPLQVDSEKNPAYIKIVSKNNWRTESGIDAKEVPIYDGPGAQYAQVGKVSIFRIRYAYDRREGNDGKTYIFLGDSAAINVFNPSVTLSGWIDEQYAIPWPSRIGVYYNKENVQKRREPTRIYRTMADLKQAVSSSKRGNPIAEEQLGKQRSLSPSATRFPVLESRKDLMKIAFVGDAFNQEGQRVSKEMVDESKDNTAEKLDRTQQKDVLFLIDATTSMGPYFTAVKNGLNAFLSNLDKSELQRFRFGVAIYRDYQDKNGGFELLGDLGTHNVFSLLKSSNAKSVAADKDLPEALFQGIIKAAQTAGWEKGRTRAIVAIGDHGNHEPDKFTVNDVAQALQEQGGQKRQIFFYSINVNRKKATLFMNTLFDKQVKQIVALNGGQGHNFQIYAEGQKDDYAEVENQVYDSLNRIVNFSSALGGALKATALGKTKIEIEATYGTQVTNYLASLMEEYGVKREQLDLSNLKQICEDGWVSKKDAKGNVQLKPWILMDRTSFDQLVGFMAGLYSELSQASSRKLKDSITEMTKRASGDPIKEGERLSEYLQRRFNIPFSEVSSVLQYTATELDQKFRSSPNFRKDMLKQVEMKYYYLHLVQEGKTARLVWDEGTSRWQKVDRQPKDWWFKTLSYVEFAWIPMEYMP